MSGRGKGGSGHCNTTNFNQLQSMIQTLEFVMAHDLLLPIAPMAFISENNMIFKEKRIVFGVRETWFKFWLCYSRYDKLHYEELTVASS